MRRVRGLIKRRLRETMDPVLQTGPEKTGTSVRHDLLSNVSFFFFFKK